MHIEKKLFFVFDISKFNYEEQIFLREILTYLPLLVAVIGKAFYMPSSFRNQIQLCSGLKLPLFLFFIKSINFIFKMIIF